MAVPNALVDECALIGPAERIKERLQPWKELDKTGKIGTLVFLGFVNGARARAKVVAVEADGAFELEVVGTEPAPAPLPITLYFS